MKKLIFIFAIALLASCKTTYQMTTTTIDFGNYNKNGFMITTSSIGGAYESLGIISTECEPGYIPRQTSINEKEKSDVIYGSPTVKLTGQYGDCNKADLVDALYLCAVKLMANALIDVKFHELKVKIDGNLRVIHSASGLAVKTK